MKTNNVRRYSMLVRVKEFGAAHADLFPADSLGERTFAELGGLIGRISAYVGSESSGRNEARQGGLTKGAAREALRTALVAVARTARGIGVDTPDVADKFRLPVIQSDHELATTAQRFVADVTPLSDAFVAHGLPSTVVADLRAKVDAFERARSTQATARESHVGARAGIDATMGSAFALLQRLDAIVENRIGGDPDLLAAWRSARHVEQTMRAVKPAAAPAATATSSAAGTQAAVTGA
jgi:hypothetical protein